MEHVEQVQLICVLETVSVVLQGICTVGFISVPSLFYIAAQEARSEDEDPEDVESLVTTILTFIDVFLIFLLIFQILVVMQMQTAFAEKNAGKLKPWLIYNLVFYFVALAACIAGIILLTSSYGLHIAAFLFLMYRAWTLIQVLLFYRELNSREPLNSKAGTDIEVNE